MSLNEQKSRTMTPRVKAIYDRVRKPEVVFSVEKASLFTKAYQEHEGEADPIRMANAQAYMMEHIPIYLLDGDLIAGAPASKPMAVEADFWTKGTWQKEGIESLRGEEYAISDEDASKMYELTEYWHKIIPEYKLYELYDDEMWAWKRSGYLLPVNNTLEEAAGMGYACNGMAILPEADTYQIDYGYVIGNGLQAIIDEAKEELGKYTALSIRTDEDVDRINLLKSFIIINEAVIRWANRYADLCDQLAGEAKDEKRKAELREMAENCRVVPQYPAKTFKQAMQFQWFIFLMISCQTTTPLGRMDQYLYPYYKADIQAGIIDDETVLEYLELYRTKFMQMKNTSGGQSRLKWSGQARWNSATLGGVDRDGNDVTNELSYLFLEAAYRCPTPHHTLHVRVSDKTPEALMMKSLELVKTGIGMPSFISDECYIGNLVKKGVPLEVARDYYIIGCVDVTVPEGWGMVFSMMVNALAFDTFMHDGYSPMLKQQIGPHTGDVRGMKTYEEFREKMIEHMTYFMEYFAQDYRLRYLTAHKHMQDPFPISLFSDGVKIGKIGKDRQLPYGIGPTMNIGIGTINVGDSVAVIKKLVFDDKVLTMDELLNALDANWEGERNQAIRNMCLAVPKYGNDNEETDAVVSDIYSRLADAGCQIDSYRVGPDGKIAKFCVAGISITSHDPGGRLCGATPDGRYAGKYLADGAASPIQGMDTHGPTAMLNSALKIPQKKLQSLLLNMKLHPSALQNEEDMSKLSMMIRTYLSEGGKQIQFNVVDQELLKEAQKHPEEHKDLIVRVAGYSAYFVTLAPNVQDELIARTTHMVL